MTKLTYIQDYKKIRKLHIIIADLSKVEKLISSSIKTIGTYKRYTPARNILMNLLENKALVVLHLNKCKEMVEHYNANKLEKVSEKHTNSGEGE